MYSNVIHENTRRVFEKIANQSYIGDFYLAGGTALAIQFGHRESIDLDWFSAENFSNDTIRDELGRLGIFKLENQEKGTMHGMLDDVRVSFLYYPYSQIYPFVIFQGIQLADERDIAAMKLDAASTRGSKKDFIDIYFLLQKYSLKQLIEFFEKKFSHIAFNKLHILKSLCYFEDAQDEPMPIMLKHVEWKEVQEKIRYAVNDYLK